MLGSSTTTSTTSASMHAVVHRIRTSHGNVAPEVAPRYQG